MTAVRGLLIHRTGPTTVFTPTGLLVFTRRTLLPPPMPHGYGTPACAFWFFILPILSLPVPLLFRCHRERADLNSPHSS